MKSILVSNKKDNGLYDFIAEDIVIVESQDIVREKDFVEKYLKNNEEYIIYIPTIRITDSALSYTGVRLSLWVYMYMILYQNVKFHIVLLGTETKGAFFEHCKFANIILAPNVHYVLNSKKSIEYFLKTTDIKHHVDKENLIDALKRVSVEPPTAFKSAHTITNEWCISRWSRALGIEVTNNEIENSLYFTYLKTILSINEVPNVRNTCTSNNKVLVVDDEVEKGWKGFFEALLPGHVRCIGEDFKKAKSKEEIIQQVRSAVEEYNPDIVILDLRLHDSDHNNQNPKVKLTGVKILEEIKRYNKGIQVIGFTASNKVWNFLAWQEFGIDSFIIKESPSKSIESGYTEKSIKQLVDAIEKAAGRAYLKDIYITNHGAIEKMRQLKKDHLLNKNLVDSVIGYLQLAQSSLFATKPNYDTAFVYYFLILEAFSKQMIDDEGVQGIDKLFYFQFRRNKTYLMIFNEQTGEKTNKKLYCGKVTENQHNRIPYNQKLYNMIDYSGLHDINPVNLVNIRNSFNHPDLIKESKPIVLCQQNVVDIMKVVSSLINNYR